MTGVDGARDGAREAMVWLAIMGASDRLGSEPLVGWQWYARLKDRVPLGVLTSRVFDDPDLLPDDARRDMIFLDSGAADGAAFALDFAGNLLGWWRAVRRHLKRHASPQDRLLITVPAAVWMLPWIGGLPIGRDRIFFGPMGLDYAPPGLARPRDPRDLRTAAALRLWRLFAPGLPAALALRAPVPDAGRLFGPRFRMLGALPEVAPPPAPPMAPVARPQAVAVLHDPRPRKRFGPSLAHAARLARGTGLPLAIIGAPATAEAGIAAAAQMPVRFLPRMPREGFRAWLAEEAPHVVALSASEGVPSTLLEALLAGCRVHVHAVGGLQWLIAVGVDREEQADRPPVVSFRWTDESRRAYARETAAAFERLLAALLDEGPPPP
jgi:hypothetical protein